MLYVGFTCRNFGANGAQIKKCRRFEKEIKMAGEKTKHTIWDFCSLYSR